ncbi:RHS repeat-associated core domain-containing protein [Sedimentibacter saalensis]|uniref:RHS repeat-associated protein n=4 Tax=Sedimentibacter saalensis TaxID=130788 RepID=A0A562J5C5_9FIRM|nr:RHS repeat-associated protein [Sedimentibacter saalensis]
MSKTDAEGGVSSKTYDADGRLIKFVNEEGAQTHYIYDDCGRIVKMTDALGNATLYTYDEMDRVLTVTDARGGVTSYTYTDRGNVATETNAEGYTVSYEYDGRHNMVKKTTVDGSTTYIYDALDRLVSITTPDGKTETFEYNGEGKIISSTDKGGHKTRYKLDANGNIVETIDAMGNSALFEYDSMNNLIKTSMHRIDTQDNVDEWEITLYEFDGRGLVTKEVNALGSVTTYVYDGNGNLKTKTDADGKVTVYAYNGLDMITSINYNGGKEVSYRYNKVGDLVEMNDWTGKTSFEVDLLNRITRTTDTKGKVVEYNYDETGNQTSVKYPDNTTAAKTYDLLGNLKSVTETDGRTTRYTYDGMNRISKMEYPHGWVEDYQYDSVGQLLNVTDTDPSNNDMKQQKHAYTYDDCGNMTYEYMRGNGIGEATVENTYTYDALHRVTSAHENYGNKTRTYQYDSLGNLTYETELGNKSIDYKFNNLNQITKKSEDSWNTQSDFTYDRRGNLIQETYTKNSKISVTGEYTYDETNKMVLGVNELGESSAYLYNSLGALVENTWVIKKNAYGYHDVSALTNMVAGEVVVDPQTGKKDKKDKLAPEVVAASPELNKTSTVVKQFVLDYTSDTFEPLMEYEVNSLEYRYVYGNDRLSVNITGVDTSAGNLIENVNQIRLYYHMDYLGTADYLTSPMTGKVESWTHYNEWGEITHNAVLKCGQRELDMVKRYATHDYDSVLSMYYAKARFYDAQNRRFASIDPILDGSVYDITDYAKDPVQLVQYLYVKNNPVIYIDPDGLRPVIDDLDPYGAYSEKSFDYRYYRQEHKDMFIEGIVSSATAPVHGFDLSQARDYQKKIKKCDNNLISDEKTNKDKIFELQTRYRNANTLLETAAVIADMTKYTWSLRYNNARNYYIIGAGGNQSAGEAFDVSMGYLIGSQVSYVAGQSIKGVSSQLNKIKGTVNSWKNAGLLDELASNGVKYTADDVLAVTKTADGKLVWLESGNSKAGMQHILEHADDFAQKGIQQSQIKDLVMESLTNGKIVGYQGRGTGRPIYEVTFGGKTYQTAITVGDNGFIVGANPTTWP